MEKSKIYKKGSKNSADKKPTLLLIKKEKLDFIDTFIKFKIEQGYHKRAYTRADLVDDAINDFMVKEEENFMQYASKNLQNEAVEKNIFSK